MNLAPEIRKVKQEREEIVKIAAVQVQAQDRKLIETAEMMALEDARAAGGRFDTFRGGFFDDEGSRLGSGGEFASLPTTDISRVPRTWFKTDGELGSMRSSSVVAKGNSKSSRRFAAVDQNTSSGAARNFKTKERLELQDVALNTQYGFNGVSALKTSSKQLTKESYRLMYREEALRSKVARPLPVSKPIKSKGPIALRLTSPEDRKVSEEEWETESERWTKKKASTVTEATGTVYSVYSKRHSEKDWFCQRCAAINVPEISTCPRCGHRKGEVYIRGNSRQWSRNYKILCTPGTWKCAVCRKLNFESASVSELAEEPGYAEDLLKLFSAMNRVSELTEGKEAGYLHACRSCDSEKFHSRPVLGVLKKRNPGDWLCPHCSANNSQRVLTCQGCGFERPDHMSELENVRRKSGMELCFECGAVVERNGHCSVCRRLEDRRLDREAAERKQKLLVAEAESGLEFGKIEEEQKKKANEGEEESSSEPESISSSG